MANAIINQVAVDIEDLNQDIMFRANGSSIKFKGMLAVYSEVKDEDDEDNNKKENKDLP